MTRAGNVLMLQKWRAHGREMVKVNFNGAIDRNSCHMGLGVVIRDANGEVLGARATRMHGVDDPFMVEAYAADYALDLEQDLGFTKLVTGGLVW